MAAPIYNVDLLDITLAESTTGWAALGGGGAGLGTGSDFAMQGTLCVDKQVGGATGAEKGQIFDFGGTITGSSSTALHFYIWAFLATPGLADSLANRGLAAILGTSTSAYVQFAVEGNETYGAGGRVGKCYPIKYINTTGTNRTLVGAPGADPRWFGGTTNITSTVKGANLGIDAMRYGTGAYITSGDSGTPATFNGFQSINDGLTKRWGVLTLASGSYELQGKFVVGQTSGGTPTGAYFDDSNKTIVIIDTIHSSSGFSQIIVDNALTVFNLTNITIKALGIINKGRLVFNNGLTQSTLLGCTFDSIYTTVLSSGVTAINSTWILTSEVTQDGATLSGCTFDNIYSGVSVLSNNPSTINRCVFNSNGSNHGLRITVPGIYNLIGNKFNDYASVSGATGNEAVFNDSGGLVTLNITSGGDVPSYRNGGSASTGINANVTITLTGLVNPSEVRIYFSDTETEIDGNENVTTGSFVFSVGSGVTVDVRVLSLEYQIVKVASYSTLFDATLPIQQIIDRQYANP